MSRHSKQSRNPFNTPLTSSRFEDNDSGSTNYNQWVGYNKNRILTGERQARLNAQASKLIQEANFIGLVNDETRPHYVKLGSLSEAGFETVKHILKILKAPLIKRYDQLAAKGELNKLPFEEYALLYRAKFLDRPQKSNRDL